MVFIFCSAVFLQSSSLGSGTIWPTRTSWSDRRTDKTGSGHAEPSRKFVQDLISGSHQQSMWQQSNFVAYLICLFGLYSLPRSLCQGLVSSRILAWEKGSFYQQRSSTVSPIIRLATTSRTPQGSCLPTHPLGRWGLKLIKNLFHCLFLSSDLL